MKHSIPVHIKDQAYIGLVREDLLDGKKKSITEPTSLFKTEKIQPPKQALIERFTAFIGSIQAKVWLYGSIVGFLLLTAVLMGIYHERPQKERLTQTEYVTKLGTENAQYQSEIGIEMAKQVQMAKDKKAKEEAFNKSSEIYSGSVGRVLELKEKIRLNEEKMQEQIIN